MQLLVEPEIVGLFPDLRIGILIAEGINNRESDAALEQLKIQSAEQFRKRFTTDSLLENPCIRAWREAYGRFGVKPKDHRPTAEALLRRVLNGHPIPAISKLVDSYLVVETQFQLPIGGYDLDRVAGNIRLRISDGGEDFVPLGSVEVQEQTSVGEIVYADDVQILTRRWNYRDCDSCKIRPESTRIALFSEAPISTVSTEHLALSLDALKELIGRFCGGSIRTLVADTQKALTWEIALPDAQ